MKSGDSKGDSGDDKDDIPVFVQTSTANDGSGHSVGITKEGVAYTWTSRSNQFGQLGREVVTNERKNNGIRNKNKSVPTPVNLVQQQNEISSDDVQFVDCFAGGTKESGHTALLDTTRTQLWMAGCDRWQQLGLGSSTGGSAGYTWKNGSIWNNYFQLCESLTPFLKQQHHNSSSATTADQTQTIRDVALGGDHTVVLLSDQRTVITFGRGEHGQLGVIGKPFVSAPTKSSQLSLSSNNSTSSRSNNKIAAVCAPFNCSITLDSKGSILNQVGQCRHLENAIERCRAKAKNRGLIYPSSSEKAT